jgi:hypothetical protein
VELYPAEAERSAYYLKKRNEGQELNARLFVRDDRARLPENTVAFGDEPEELRDAVRARATTPEEPAA